METYKHKSIGFIFDLKNPQKIAEVKKNIIEFFKTVENDDDFYIYNESKVCFNQGSNAIACLAQYRFKTNPSLYLLIKDALQVLNLTSTDDRRLYIITDSVDISNDYKLEKIIQQTQRQKYQVLFLSLTSKDVKYQYVDTNDLLEILLNNYRQDIKESYGTADPVNRSPESPIGSLTFFPFSG